MSRNATRVIAAPTRRRWFRVGGVIATAVVLFLAALPRLVAEIYYVRIASGIGRYNWFAHLESLGGAATPVLVRLLRDRDAVDRSFAAESLGAMRAGSAVQALMDTARGDPDVNVVGAAIQALGRIGDQRALPVLRELAQTDTRALAALPLLGAAGEQALRDLIHGHPDQAWRGAALETACQNPALDVREQVRTALGDPAPAVRAAAVECARLRPGADTLPALEALAGDADPVVRADAAALLAAAGDARGVATLAALASNAASPTVARTRAVHALAKTRQCGELSRLKSLASDASRAVAAAAASALSSLQGPCGKPSLSPAEVAQFTTAVRVGGARAVSVVGSIAGGDPSDADLVPALVEALASTEPELRGAAARALTRIGPRAQPAVPALLRLLQDPERSVRVSAIHALGRVGAAAGPAAIGALRAALDDEGVRNDARAALARIEGGAR